jgi:hypothetical protein
MSQVNVELGFSATALISLNDAAVRNLAEVASGTISLQNLRGKANVFAFAIAANQTSVNLRTLAVNAGWNQTAPVQATINSGVVISGNTQANSTAALTVDGSWPGGVTLTNNGTIVGRGGDGGAGGAAVQGSFTLLPGTTAGSPGAAGGRGLLVSVALSLNNAGTIAGGGGGGGGGGGAQGARFTDGGDFFFSAGGGGGGGGRSSNTNSGGGAGGVSNQGTNGSAGGAGTISAPGGGGAGNATNASECTGGNGGGGAAYGTAGATGATSSSNQGFIRSGGAGGAAGQAISGNSNITYIATGTRLGPIV